MVSLMLSRCYLNMNGILARLVLTYSSQLLLVDVTFYIYHYVMDVLPDILVGRSLHFIPALAPKQ